MRTKQRPTLQDVADAAGVSSATVSRALNDPDKVAKPAREKIDAAIMSLGYTPNFGARALATNKTNTVGAIIPALSNAMFASGIQAFQEVLAEAGITLLIATSGYDPETELRQIKLLAGQGASGLLLIGDERPTATTDFLSAQRIPYVLSWSFRENAQQTFVGFDNFTAARDATRRILDLGHTDISIIAGDCTHNDRARARRDGAIAAIKEFGANITNIIEAPYRIDAGRQACKRLMETGHQTAIVCGNDVLAAGAMVGARELGLDVPRDVSVLGFDDIGLASVVTPPMTTVRVPQIEMGRAAAQTLLDLVAGKNATSIKLETEFISRGSIGPAPV